MQKQYLFSELVFLCKNISELRNEILKKIFSGFINDYSALYHIIVQLETSSVQWAYVFHKGPFSRC